MRTEATFLLVGLALVVAGCGSQPPPDIEVIDAFTIPGDGSLALYLTVTNEGGDDRIVGAELSGPDTDRADSISLHVTTNRDGLAVMESTDAILVSGGTPSALQPGSGHLMVTGLVGTADLGDTLNLLVRFDRSDPIDVTVEVVTVEDALDRLHSEEQTP